MSCVGPTLFKVLFDIGSICTVNDFKKPLSTPFEPTNRVVILYSVTVRSFSSSLKRLDSPLPHRLVTSPTRVRLCPYIGIAAPKATAGIPSILNLNNLIYIILTVARATHKKKTGHVNPRPVRDPLKIYTSL